MSGPIRWTCAHCGGHLAWTATTVGCQPCGHRVDLVPTSAKPADESTVAPILTRRFTGRRATRPRKPASDSSVTK